MQHGRSPRRTDLITNIQQLETKKTDIAALLSDFSDDLQGSAVLQDKVAPDFIVPGYSFAAIGSQDDSSNITFQRASEALGVTMTKLENNLTVKDFEKSSAQVKGPTGAL